MTRSLKIAALLALFAWLTALAPYYLLHVPGLALSMEPLGVGLRALLAAALWGLACLGTGALVMQRVLRVRPDEDVGWLEAGAVGLGIWGLISLPWALVFGPSPWAAAALLLLMAGSWLARPALPPLRWPSLSGLLPLLFLLPALLSVLAPVTDTDELYYHLALPRQMLDEGRLLGGFWYPNGSRPLALHLPWAWLLATGGESAPRFFHLGLAGLLLVGVHLRARRWWGPSAGALAPLLLVGSTSFLQEAGLAYNDIPAAFCAWIAFDAALRGRGRLLGLCAGAAVAIKYTAIVAVFPLFILLFWEALGGHRPDGLPVPWRQQAARALLKVGLAGLLASAMLAPWWLRNVLQGLHPLFPYTGWGTADGFAFQYPEKYGLGHGFYGLLWLPWRLLMRAEPDSFVFLGRLNPALLALLPLSLLRCTRCRPTRWALLVSAMGLLAWSQNIQLLRYLVPLLPILALAAASGVVGHRPLRVAAWGLWALGLFANLTPVLRDASQRIPVSLGWETREDYQEQHLTAWRALAYLNTQTLPDARVALLFTWHAYPLQRSWLVGSVEDHIPTRFLLHTRGDDTLAALREQQVTHVLVQRIHFLQKQYAFLDEATFQRQFRQPETQLEALLAAQARLVFEDGKFSVWEL